MAIMNSNVLNDMTQCCGCGVCENVCKTGAITMTETKDGFLYPVIDSGKCVNCKSCVNHCPVAIHDKLKIDTHNVACYAGYITDDEKLSGSASGGAATAIAEYILSEGGVVFGVAYSDAYTKAVTVKVSTVEELNNIRDSKYMQSNKGQIYKEVKQALDAGQKVLYTGTPCEIGAVKAFLNKSYDNLFTCEIICHGTTTYKVVEQYIRQQEKEHNSRLVKMSVRSKDNGWRVPHIKLQFENGDVLLEKFYETNYGKAFAVYLRESCYKCLYKGKGKVADITVGDFWGVTKNDEYWNANGISSVMVHSEKGQELIDNIKGLKLFDVEYTTILAANKTLEHSEPRDKVTGLLKFNFCHMGLKKAIGIHSVYRKVIGGIKGMIRR